MRTAFIKKAKIALFLFGVFLGLGHAAHAEPLVFATSKSGWLAWLAEELDYFNAAGVDVKLERVSSGAAAGPGLIDKRFHIATLSEFAFASLVFNNPDLRVFGTIAALKNVRLVGRKDHGIRDAEALKGKTIGLRKKSISEFLLGRILELHGIDIDEVTFVDIPTPDLPKALSDGRVDAIVSWEPYATYSADAVGNQRFEMTMQGRQPYYFSLAARSSVLKERGGDIRKVLSALIKASKWAEKNPEKTKRLLSRKLEIDPTVIENLSRDYIIDVSLQQDLLVLMEDEAIWRVERGLSQGPVPNMLYRIDISPLVDVDPSRVTIIR